jgi:predicted MFS family arabinose efflux permease
MSPDLGVGTGGLGTLTATFYVGLGLMQIPGGVLAARWGPKRVVLLGLVVSSLAVLGVSASSSLAEIAVLRLAVGAGMALVFAPAVVLVARHLGGRTGAGVGLFNSAYDIGGVLGLFGWVVVATAAGWRESLVLSGGLGLLTALLVALCVPREARSSEFRVSRDAFFKVLGNGQLIILGLATLGLSVGNVLISGFMVEYLVKSLHYSPELAGLVSSMVVVLPIFTAIWGGRVYERAARPRTVMVLVVLGSGLALLVCSFPSIYAALACAVVGGVAAGVGFTFAFAGAKDLNRAGPSYDGLAIAWVNGISLTGAFLPPLFYSYAVGSWGYPAAWQASAALCLVFLVPMALMAERFRG